MISAKRATKLLEIFFRISLSHPGIPFRSTRGKPGKIFRVNISFSRGGGIERMIDRLLSRAPSGKKIRMDGTWRLEWPNETRVSTLASAVLLQQNSAICPSKEIETTSFRSLPQSSFRSSYHGYVTSTSRFEESRRGCRTGGKRHRGSPSGQTEFSHSRDVA